MTTAEMIQKKGGEAPHSEEEKGEGKGFVPPVEGKEASCAVLRSNQRKKKKEAATLSVPYCAREPGRKKKAGNGFTAPKNRTFGQIEPEKRVPTTGHEKKKGPIAVRRVWKEGGDDPL